MMSPVWYAWPVLLLVFVLELAAWAAFGVWGWASSPRWLLVWLLPLAVVVLWGLTASPRARYGGRLVRPVVKVLVFGGAVLALRDSGHPAAAAVLAVAVIVVHLLARLPAARAAASAV